MVNYKMLQNKTNDYEFIQARQNSLGLSAYTCVHIPEWVRNARVFHVMIYGHKDSQLITSRADAEKLIRKLVETATKKGTSILHFAVMSNHIHIVIWGENWKDVSSTIRSTTMSLAMHLRKTNDSREPTYTKKILYSACTTSGSLLKIMRYVSENAKDTVHTCYFSAAKEYMYHNFLYVDTAKVCELTDLDLNTICLQLISEKDDFDQFMSGYYKKSELSISKFLPKGMLLQNK